MLFETACEAQSLELSATSSSGRASHFVNHSKGCASLAPGYPLASLRDARSPISWSLLSGSIRREQSLRMKNPFPIEWLRNIDVIQFLLDHLGILLAGTGIKYQDSFRPRDLPTLQ
jgi:hypothetical protein